MQGFIHEPYAMRLDDKQLRLHIQARDLLSLRRKAIDQQRSVQGVLISFSDHLLLFQHIHDFHLDGHLVVRRKDVTKLSCRDTDRFQRGLLETEGLFNQIDFGFHAPIQSYESFLASRPEDEVVIVEDELSDPQTFLIGTLSHVERGAVYINHFSGTGRRLELPEQISPDRITSCQIGTNYTKFYERHFSRVDRTV